MASVNSHLACQFESIRIHIRDNDIACSRVPHDGRRHDPDWPGAGDQDILSQHRKGKRRVNSVSERIENRSNLAVGTVGA